MAEQHEMDGDQGAGNQQAGDDLLPFLELKGERIGADGNPNQDLRQEKIGHR
jgi:hypothetical protein